MHSRSTVEKRIKDIKRKTRRRFNTEEKFRIVLEGIKGETSIAELCHSSVTITEKYANFFSFEELEDDFRALKDGSSFLDFMRRVPPPSDKSPIRPTGGVESSWGNQSMGNYKYSLVRK